MPSCCSIHNLLASKPRRKSQTKKIIVLKTHTNIFIWTALAISDITSLKILVENETTLRCTNFITSYRSQINATCRLFSQGAHRSWYYSVWKIKRHPGTWVGFSTCTRVRVDFTIIAVGFSICLSSIVCISLQKNNKVNPQIGCLRPSFHKHLQIKIFFVNSYQAVNPNRKPKKWNYNSLQNLKGKIRTVDFSNQAVFSS